MKKEPLIILTGPTAVGKTELSIALAKAVNGEIISADSMQVYRYMDIGTAKITKEEMQGVKHYLVDEIEPSEGFDVARFKSMATNAIEKIRENGHIPVVVGGTGFYIQALLYDSTFEDDESDYEYRDYLQGIADTKGAEVLHDMLKEADPESAEAIHANNGLLDEVKHLSDMGLVKDDVAMQGIGYKEVFDYLEGRCDEAGLREMIKQDTRHFAKRQLTWFRREPSVTWVDFSQIRREDALSYMLEQLKEKEII